MDHLEMSKFTWRIDNFSELDDEKLYSLTFVVNQKKWNLVLYPEGEEDDENLSLYLCMDDSSISQEESSVPTTFSISIVNQLDSKKTITLANKRGHIFMYGSSGWGSSTFMELSKFQDETEGYLVEDTCLIEAVIDISPNDSDSQYTIDPVKLGYIEAQSFLESLAKPPIPPSGSAYNPPTCDRPFFEGYVTFAKGILDKLISYHLDDFADPKNEAAMMDFISVLANNISAFSDAQAKEIVNLRATFPQIVQEWRDSIQVKGSGEPARSTFEETKRFLQQLVKREEGLRTELEELSKKETELGAELEAIESMSLMPKEERVRVSKHMKIFCCLLEEKFSSIGAQDLEVNCANQQLEERLKSKWEAMSSLFAKRKTCDGEFYLI